MQVLAFTGSLRRGSFNTATLRACKGLAPDGMHIELYERLGDIPPYNDDVWREGFPESVVSLRAKMTEAHALLIATPEYNHSIPGVLKNAIDWASREPACPLFQKPVAILGASLSMLGTARAQYHLRDILTFFDSRVVNKPEVFIGSADKKFSSDGELKDQTTCKVVQQLLAALAEKTMEQRHLAASVTPAFSATQLTDQAQ